GEGNEGSRLNPNDFVNSSSNSELLAFILSGRDGTAMGGFQDRLTEEQIAHVIAFIREWQDGE
ncbi:MAG: cytochrome c, partial [Chloroflexi bacterium]|nr:cytochrome c [Chloroflexota bacterium]